MTMTTIFQTAQSIEVNRTKLMAQTVSRNGRLLVAARNWVNPWRFTVTPRPYWNPLTERSAIEAVINADRFTPHTVYLGTNAYSTSGSNWMMRYQGDIPEGVPQPGNIVANGASGTTVTVKIIGATQAYIATQPGTFAIFRAGDVIQATGNLYPHVVTQDITKSMLTEPQAGVYQWSVPIHRGWIGTSPVNAALKWGNQCDFRLIVTKMPTYRYLPGQILEFTSDFELMEYVV